MAHLVDEDDERQHTEEHGGGKEKVAQAEYDAFDHGLLFPCPNEPDAAARPGDVPYHDLWPKQKINSTRSDGSAENAG